MWKILYMLRQNTELMMRPEKFFSSGNRNVFVCHILTIHSSMLKDWMFLNEMVMKCILSKSLLFLLYRDGAAVFWNMPLVEVDGF